MVLQLSNFLALDHLICSMNSNSMIFQHELESFAQVPVGLQVPGCGPARPPVVVLAGAAVPVLTKAWVCIKAWSGPCLQPCLQLPRPVNGRPLWGQINALAPPRPASLFAGLWTSRASLLNARGDMAMVTLPGDRLLVMGGETHARGDRSQVRPQCNWRSEGQGMCVAVGRKGIWLPRAPAPPCIETTVTCDCLNQAHEDL